MIKKTIFFICINCIALAGCNNGSSQTDSEKNSQTDTTSLRVIGKDSGAVKTSSTGVDPGRGSDSATAARIKKVLPIIFKKELAGADSTARRFIYDQADLDGDGKNELFVGFTGMNWCGSGGCTALLLSSEGEKITHFTVTDFPFTILSHKTKGWKDLVVRSGGADRVLHWNGKGYPANPSTAPKFTGKLSGDSYKVLDLKSGPWLTF